MSIALINGMKKAKLKKLVNIMTLFNVGKLSRSVRTCFALCTLLLCSLFSAPALWAQAPAPALPVQDSFPVSLRAAATSYPFDGYNFTYRGASSIDVFRKQKTQGD
jgi:hypothetical protein